MTLQQPISSDNDRRGKTARLLRPANHWLRFARLSMSLLMIMALLLRASLVPVPSAFAASGFTVSTISGNTTETGGSATFTVVLTGQPTANVTIPISSNDTTEGTVSSASLTFTSLNWNIAQTVTVTGVDDNVDDGDIAYAITTGTATSTDLSYNGLNPNDVNVTNVDNDTAGFTVSTISGNTTEGGGTATFTVVLNSQPTANVSFPLNSSDTGEGRIGPVPPNSLTLTFTTATWNVPQTVTVTGRDDFANDGDTPYMITTAAATSTDPKYNNLNPANVSVINLDDETTRRVIVTNITGHTTEAGGTATFSVRLSAVPNQTVTIGLTSSDLTEGTVSPASLTFTTANTGVDSWQTLHTVTVTGVNDDVDDGDIAYTIIIAAATGGNYAGVNAADVPVINDDNDTAGFTVSAISGNTTEAAGPAATFTVKLNSQPTANVVIGLSSSNTGEGTVSPATLTFTSVNWNAAQTVTVAGVNDNVDDGNIAYTIITAPAVSTDSSYSLLNPANVSVTNIDNDTAGITVAPISGLATTETGGTDSFTVVLNSQPLADVTIPLSSNDTTEGTVSPASLTFTSANWNTPQTATVTGVNDAVDDGDIAYTIVTGAATSADTSYSAVNAADVAVTNTDDDTAGFSVSGISGNTTEAGGSATFTVVLNSQPTADVTIPLSSSDATEGSVSPASLTFTSANWATAQTVTATGVNDAVDDGDIAYSIITGAATSTDLTYNGINADNVDLSNIDDDGAGIVVSTISGDTTEAGGTATFTVKLASQPTADVSIGVSSDDSSEGTAAPATLTFTAADWDTAQTVTVTGVDDDVDDGDITYAIAFAAATSSDATYNGRQAADEPVTNIDDDTAGISVSTISGNTTEAGGTATFTVVLNSQPTADVSIGVSSDNTGEGSVSPATLTFTSANWNTAQTVTVTGVNDDVDDGDIAYNITTDPAVSADVNYASLNAADLNLSNIDNDTAGITVTPTSGLVTTETGGTDSFTVKLNSQPVADVTIPLSSDTLTEGSVSATALTFTSANWNIAQTVTVTGVNDSVDDGDVAYTIITDAATSADANYSGANAADVGATNTDDDTAGVTVSAISGNTTEAGGSATFTVVLNSQPTADVSIPLSSSNATEGSVSPASLTFTSANWNIAQTVTATGVDDAVDDGDIAYSIVTGSAASTDAAYSGLDADDAPLSNIDNDGAGVTVSTLSGNTTEAGGTATFDVQLASQPTADVTIAVSSNDTTEGTVSPATLTFTSANWNTAQTVTVTGVNDNVDDGDISYQVVLDASASTDPVYNGQDAADIPVLNQDDDTAGIAVSAISGNTTEAGGTATFTVVLNSQPTADVSIDLSSDDPSEGTIGVATLTFTSANWNVAQTVTVTGVNDNVDDNNVAYSIITEPAVSTDALYNLLNSSDVSLSNSDDDTAGITVSTISGNTTEAGGTATFKVKLNSQPTADVSISLSSSDPTEGTVSPATLTFTSANWNVAQTATVTGVDDSLRDGLVAYTIVTAPASSTDALYNLLNSSDVSLSNSDDDTAGITVSAISGNTTEAGGTATFTVKLNSQPTANVRIGLSSSDTSEGTVTPAALTFTSANWNIAQTATVKGVNDNVDDNNIAYTIITAPAVSTDANYSGVNAADVGVTNRDDDTAGITVSAISGSTTEAGGTATFTVKLSSQPTANVSIGLSSSDTSEGTVSPAALTFTSANWNIAQTVTVKGVNDSLHDGSITYTIITAPATSADPAYSGRQSADVTVINIDDDPASVDEHPIYLPIAMR